MGLVFTSFLINIFFSLSLLIRLFVLLTSSGWNFNILTQLPAAPDLFKVLLISTARWMLSKQQLVTLVYMSKLQMVPNENLRQIGLRFEEEKFYVEKDEELLKYVPWGVPWAMNKGIKRRLNSLINNKLSKL